jgi:hypothetical protein
MKKDNITQAKTIGSAPMKLINSQGAAPIQQLHEIPFYEKSDRL